MALSKFKAPPLPVPPQEYNATYIQQLIRALQIYFSQLDSNTPNYAESYTADDFYGSGVGLYVPYNQFSSNIDQTAAAIDAAYALKLEETTFTNGIYIAGTNDTEITFSEPGIYTLTYSLAFKNTTNDLQEIDVWFRYNNGTGAVDVPNSNSKFAIPPRKSTGSPAYLVAVTSFTGYAEAPDVYVEIMWRVSDINVSMEHIPAVTYSVGVTPAIPATPSAIVQANFVSKAV
jgi:hypothetical protein